MFRGGGSVLWGVRIIILNSGMQVLAVDTQEVWGSVLWGGVRIIILISGMQALAVDAHEVWRSVCVGECVWECMCVCGGGVE